MKDDKLKTELLHEELGMLESAIVTLKLSVDKCSKIGVKSIYTFEEEESFDSLTSKFGRTSDLYTQKVLRTIWMLLHEPFVPFIDLLNKAEKMELINSADQMIEIRDIRNEITHEYLPDALKELVPEVIQNCEILFENINKTLAFIQNRNW